KPVQSLDFQVMLYNEAGVKMSGGLISFPDLKPGETGEVQVRIDKASRAVISNREKAQQSLKEQLTPLQASQGGITIAAYLAQRPAGPTRITADCKLGNYYNYAYRRAAATYHSVSLSQSSPFAMGHAWVPKDSEAGRLIFEALKDGQEHRLTLEVVLQ